MDEIIELAKMTPQMVDKIKYVAVAGVSGLIGNRFDAWFVSLFYHQKKNIVNWLKSQKITESDLKEIIDDEQIRHVFSSILKNVSDEIFEEKIKGWGKITDSVIRNKDIELNKKCYFINCYVSLDVISIEYLLKIKMHGGLSSNDIYGADGYPPKSNTQYEKNFIGQMNTVIKGLVAANTQGIILTDLGKEFLDFIGDEFQKTE